MDKLLENHINDLIEQFSENMKAEIKRLFLSGAIDIKRYDLRTYALPKVLVTAAVYRLKDDFKPSGKILLDDLKNLTRI